MKLRKRPRSASKAALTKAAYVVAARNTKGDSLPNSSSRTVRISARAVSSVQYPCSTEGVDEETWVYHLKRGDYARWFRDKIQDQELDRRNRTTSTRR